MPRKMCIMHKFLGIMIKGAHHKGPINQGAAFRIETFFKSSCSEKIFSIALNKFRFSKRFLFCPFHRLFKHGV